MKLKAVATASMPKPLLNALDSTELDDAFCAKMAVQNLHVDTLDLGPATHYVQFTDYSIPRRDGSWGIEVTLSKVSANESRSGKDFKRTMLAVQNVYRDLIEQHLYTDEETQLFVVLALDDKVKIDGSLQSLPELPPIWVRGKRRVPRGVKPWRRNRLAAIAKLPLHDVAAAA